MRLISWVGTRPQNLKATMIHEALQATGIPWICVTTAQHTDAPLAQAVPDARPVWDLLPEDGDVVLVEGDTRTAWQGALWAKNHGARLIHLEAGCRAFTDLPEEHIRVAVDHLADWHLCVSEHERTNLLKEGCPARRIYVVGDVLWALFQRVTPPVLTLPAPSILLTMHRHDVTPPAVRLVLGILRNHGTVVFPAHPRVAPWVDDEPEVLPALPYETLRGYLRACDLVATDSGGLCREAFMAGKPCLVLRTACEWTQLLALGRHRLVGVDAPAIGRALADPWPDCLVGPAEVFGHDPVGQLTAALLDLLC